MIEPHYSLRRAAKLTGISRPTLKKWLREDLGVVLPPITRGSKVLISAKELEFVIRRRSLRLARG